MTSSTPRSFRPRAAWLTAAVGICCALPAAAHDFWVQPNEYWLAPQVTTGLTLQVGHGPFRQRSPIRVNRITRFEARSSDGSSLDLRAALHPGEAASDGELRFQTPGTYVLVLTTDARAQSHLPALRFNDYLNAEGLTPALQERERSHRANADGSETYSRIAKSIVQIGPAAAETAAQVTRPLGLPLEIVPEQSPYAVPRPALLPVRVFYEGQPLPGALIKLTNLAQDAEPVETHRTDSDGRASFEMPKEGAWLLNVIWTKPLPPTCETDFETVFSSLSFGLPPPRP